MASSPTALASAQAETHDAPAAGDGGRMLHSHRGRQADGRAAGVRLVLGMLVAAGWLASRGLGLARLGAAQAPLGGVLTAPGAPLATATWAWTSALAALGGDGAALSAWAAAILVVVDALVVGQLGRMAGVGAAAIYVACSATMAPSLVQSATAAPVALALLAAWRQRPQKPGWARDLCAAATCLLGGAAPAAGVLHRASHRLGAGVLAAAALAGAASQWAAWSAKAPGERWATPLAACLHLPDAAPAAVALGWLHLAAAAAAWLGTAWYAHRAGGTPGDRPLLLATAALAAWELAPGPLAGAAAAPLVAALALVAARRPAAWAPWAAAAAAAGLAGALGGVFAAGLAVGEPLPVALATARTAMMAATVAAVWLELRRAGGAASAGAGAGPSALAAVVAHPAWAGAAAVLALGWVLAANLSETTANDIWIQLRVGREILASGHFPSRETYSATVLGRPFIAHEWLSSVLFHLMVAAFGDAGLSILGAAVALAAGLLLWAAVPAASRRTAWFLPLWLATNYLISFRMLMRPHIFTIAAQCALVWAIEHWRRSGKTAHLWALVPLQLLWINLHGAAFFGPAFVAMMAALAALMAAVPGLQRGSEPRLLGRSDAWRLALVAAAMALGCLCNPYGRDLLRWSLALLGNDYAKTRVWEWTPPVSRANLHYYWLWLYLAVMATMWAAVVVRWRRLPLFDAAVAATVSTVSLGANRFVPDLAVFALPIMVRGAEYAASALGPAWPRRRVWGELGLCTLLWANLAAHGFAHSAGEHRPLPGWGFGGDMPYQEVALLEKMGQRGKIFNEYSDGALIIHRLVPAIRPVLDSRIDIYPRQVIDEYDRAYTRPDHLAAYLDRHKIDLVMLLRPRAPAAVLAHMAQDPAWELLSSVGQRLLWRRLRPLGGD